ncbi:unnamed protein product [Paramecium pentaurelia]|uniref:Peptidase M14 domain-containing protein n=1 Tax=Paramecium pentaurelia TaxID=43138 RepID=A0A8S1W3H0_9CILI|nr:unnamed protein product [Paramecium pentaurelia]
MDDEGFESAFIETLITQQDKQPTFIFTSLPTPNPIINQLYNREVTNDIKDIENSFKCVYKKQYGSKVSNQHFKQLNLNELQTPIIIQTKQLPLFDSNFTCGNLAAVYQVDKFEYDLLLQEDINSTSYSQWFYFRLTNPNDQKCRINIINMTKNYLQYQNGFGVYIKLNSQWEVLKSQVLVKQSQYFKSNFCKTTTTKLYTLSFWINRSSKTLEIALGIPYTHLDLDRYLLKFQSEILAYTISGLPVKMVQFGSKRSDVILVIARQHPGETVSSHVCQGFLEALSNDKTLQLFYNIIVIPMVNPDGVKWGNFRCDLSGKDLNRVWQNPRLKYHQQIIQIRNLIQKILNEGRQIKTFIDLHGHSRKLGTFMYACRNNDDPIECRILPMIMAENSKYFDFNSCTFNLKSYKLKTARAFVYNQIQKFNPNSFHNIVTLETSFFGYKQDNKIIQYSQIDLTQIGIDLHQSLKIYHMQQEQKTKIFQDLELNKQYYQQIDENQPSDDSDSEPEIGIIPDENIQKKTILSKNSIKFLGDVPKTSTLKKRTLKKVSNPQLVGQYDKNYRFNRLSRTNSKSQIAINQTVQIQQTLSPNITNFYKINRNLSSHNTDHIHMHSNNGEPYENVQSCRLLRQSTTRTPKEFKMKSEQRLKFHSPNDKLIIFEQNLKIKRKNTQKIKLF